MLKSGDIVVQDRTMINNVNYKDNKDVRLSVVLFETNIDGESFVCTCPITNTTRTALKHPNSYYSSPYLIYGEKKYSCVKINAAHIYPKESIHTTGLTLDGFHVDRIFDKLMEYVETTEQEELYKMIRDNAVVYKKEFAKLSEKEVRIAQKRKNKSKQLRRKRIQDAKKGIKMA